MLPRGRSRDRNLKVTPPEASYMSNDQFADYLANLRDHRVQRPSRPSGARPQPSADRRQSGRASPFPVSDHSLIDLPPRSSSAMSHSRPHQSPYGSTASRTRMNVPVPPSPGPLIKPSEVVPSATYIERGLRWMEKEEAVSLREAMEDMEQNGVDEEAKLHAAAQNEASELVWQHQNPEAVRKPGAPYSYKDHLKKNSYAHARTQSVGRYGGLALATGLARDITPRSLSGRSNSGSHSGGLGTKGYLEQVQPDQSGVPEGGTRRPMDSVMSAASCDIPSMSRIRGTPRKRSGGKRNISGEMMGSFSGDQIWEEPEQDTTSSRPDHVEDTPAPAPLKLKVRNPLNRVQFAPDLPTRSSSTPPEPTKRFARFDNYRNPPSQSRDPAYTANPTPSVTPVSSSTTEAEAMRSSVEVRSDEIRQATSMRLKDRSPKLPTPTAVSDVSSRPIVSFDSDWKPKEADEKSELRRLPWLRSRPLTQRPRLPSRTDLKPVADSQAQSTPIPVIKLPQSPMSDIPSIILPIRRSNPIQQPEIPQVAVSPPSVPSINILEPSHPSPKRPLPSINVPQASFSAPMVPTINTSEPVQSQTKRPLPTPSNTRPTPKHNATAPLPRGHWSPALRNRATATCQQCQLPIEGRVVALRGITERFHPECFICFTCGTGLEALEISPEPEPKRNERLDRIRRRNEGEEVEEVEGQTMSEDGDERPRFYCHLDWHENFAPRCKHCKTPIIGEHAVALGEHWHYGHFFCAECGDPFEQGMTHIEKDGYAWCLKCQTQRTERRAPKCKNCRRPVIGQYVQALGGEWHDECFRCVTCKGGFDDGQIFPREVNGQTVALCMGCMERELKA